MKTSKPSSYNRTSKPKLFPKTKLACVIFYCFKNRNFRFHLTLSDLSNIQTWQSTRPIVPGNNFINIILLSDSYHPAVKWTTRINIKILLHTSTYRLKTKSNLFSAEDTTEKGSIFLFRPLALVLLITINWFYFLRSGRDSRYRIQAYRLFIGDLLSWT